MVTEAAGCVMKRVLLLLAVFVWLCLMLGQRLGDQVAAAL